MTAVLPINIVNNFSTIFSGFFFTYRWRFNKDIKLMSGSEPLWYFKAAWMLVTPATLAVRMVLSCSGADSQAISRGWKGFRIEKMQTLEFCKVKTGVLHRRPLTQDINQGSQGQLFISLHCER